MHNKARIKAILDFWFGDLTQADLPNQERTALWFGSATKIDQLIKEKFGQDLEDAIAGKLEEWRQSAHGRLALIILFDQFTRNIFRDTEKAYAYDVKALDLCLSGIELEHDHGLTLIERVFYYFPLEHAEDLLMQERSLIAYQSLMQVSMPETRVVYESFLKYAIEHYEIIKKFERFPARNAILNRESTKEELLFLKRI